LQALLAESNDYKTQANQLFSSSKYSEAISTYEKAISACPNYLYYGQAVLRSNIAACHVQLGDWKAAVKSATASLEALDHLDSKPGTAEAHGTSGTAGEGSDSLTEDGESAAKPTCTQEDRDRIRVKALMRRARANSEIGGWSALQSAEDGWCPGSCPATADWLTI
jgi:tetratricopeptide (TPR) repeat protein